ncbi:MAG: hypothetical protein C0467_27845 [Planctomycetaceae bacterium]|nr:hypothetical protein [Planctomycetaceae bacterium]
MELNESTEVGSVMVGPADAHAPGSPHDLTVTTRVLPGGSPTKFKIADNAPLLQLLEDGARHLGIHLLPPPPLRPLDRLHNIGKHDEVGPAIGDLDQSVGVYLKEKGTTKDFGIELVLAFRVNTRWAVATSHEMTPKQILALPGIGLDYQQYTLYLPGSSAPLPLDKPIHLKRGDALEAQRDGKYGEGR